MYVGDDSKYDFYIFFGIIVEYTANSKMQIFWIFICFSLRVTLRKIYKNASGREHPNWEEYDEAMKVDKRAAVVVVPREIYGTA